MRRAVAVLFAAALGVRLAFVLWAPGVPTGDGFLYHLYAKSIAAGDGYTNLDGSPGILWMPGWPAYLAALYRVFGDAGRVALLSNAALGAATAVLVATLGVRWFGRRAGLVAGWLYALWPGVVYYTATFFTETTFSFLLASTLALLAAGADARRRRAVWFAAGGLALGLCAMVKAEPLALAPVVLLLVFSACRGAGDFARLAVVTFAATAAVILPWSIRNYAVFGRVIPTSVNGGFVAYLGNHRGATGGGDFAFATWYWGQHQRETAAESNIAAGAAGWRDAWNFVRENPGEELRILGRKVALTYTSDAQGATLVRGAGPDEDQWLISRTAWRRLSAVADAWWFAVLPLAAVGLATFGTWPRPAAILLPGLVGTWFALHLVFLGGARFHVPEVLAYALLAGRGVELLAARARSAPVSRGTPRARST